MSPFLLLSFLFCRVIAQMEILSFLENLNEILSIGKIIGKTYNAFSIGSTEINTAQKAER